MYCFLSLIVVLVDNFVVTCLDQHSLLKPKFHFSQCRKTEPISCYIHPYISSKLLQIHNGMLSEDIICEFNLNIFIVFLNDLMNSLIDFKLSVSREEEVNSPLEESLRASGCSSDQYQHVTCVDDQVNREQLDRARKMEVLENSPEDELEGELVYFQHRLLQNAVRRKQFAGVPSPQFYLYFL